MEKVKGLPTADDLPNNITDEVRHPLRNIHLSVQLIKKELSGSSYGNERLITLVDLIEGECNRLGQLLRHPMFPSPQVDANFVNMNLADVIQEALEMANDRILLKKLIIEKFLLSDCIINGDPEKIRQVIVNILINSIEAIGDKIGKISISLHKNARQLVLTISDNGCGMTDHQLSLLFSSHNSIKPGGIGTGLLAVRDILEKHDATFHITGKVGKGTIFTVYFNCVS
jgi:two-component system, sporulation sensor kinase E